jgi:hypothetical protein
MALTNEQLKITDVAKIVIFIVTIAGTWYSLKYEVESIREDMIHIQEDIKTNNLTLIQYQVKALENQVKSNLDKLNSLDKEFHAYEKKTKKH